MDMPVVEGHGYFPPISVEDTPVGNVNGLMAMNTAFMKKNPGIANKIVKAFTESTRYYASNSKAMIQGARNLTGASIGILEEGMKHASLENRMFLTNAKTLAKLAFGGGIVKKNVASAVGGWMNYQFLMNATGKSKADLGG
jgi:ABC-type nitrate/sulfonate/bicarbonate transport system substrate-binding protein